ncbi:hypothetical protein QE152_g26287 [Popillia japonica]|uniref:Uncharacterized protein n=1 Tax=Popillia japonica TaxID=7064 RepID=A0AAW1JYU9_POPJA
MDVEMPSAETDSAGKRRQERATGTGDRDRAHLQNQAIRATTSALEGLHVVEKRGANQHGGVAILVRNDTPYRQLAMEGLEWNDVEAVAIQLADNTAIVCHYNRPSRKLEQRQTQDTRPFPQRGPLQSPQ